MKTIKKMKVRDSVLTPMKSLNRIISHMGKKEPLAWKINKNMKKRTGIVW